MRTSGALVLAAYAAIGGTGCASRGPSLTEFEASVRSWAGADARDCGKVLLRADRSSAMDCVRQEIGRGAPFFVIVQVQGVDSTLFHGLASQRQSSSQMFFYDSDITGGGGVRSRPRVHQRPCVAPKVTYDDEPLVCG